MAGPTIQHQKNDCYHILYAGVVGDDTFREGVVSGFLLILFSELGDKTFFIALLLALKQSQGLVFAGTFGALAVMTVISVSITSIVPRILQKMPPDCTGRQYWDDACR